MDVPFDVLAQVVDAPFAQAIVKVREGNAKVTPGYDGVYGQLVLDVDSPVFKPKPALVRVKQRSMTDFW
jgi:PHP family Zn ribbon phosphoesterase